MDADIGIPAMDESPSEIPWASPASSESDTTTEGAPKKRRRRRTKKAVEEPAASHEPTAQDVAALATAMDASFSMAFDMVAGLRGEHWRLSQEDSAQLGAVWADALAPYVGTMGKYLPFLTAGVATVAIIVPRARADAAIAAGDKLAGATPVAATVVTSSPDEPPPMGGGDVPAEMALASNRRKAGKR